jgi:hypothetical protein
MATSEQIEEVRRNTNTTVSDYNDTVVGDLIDNSSVECASATIWKWELAKLGADSAKGIKSSKGGIESHTFNSIKEQMDYYKGMYDFWKAECDKSQNKGSSYLTKVYRPSVGGVVTEDQAIEQSGF